MGLYDNTFLNKSVSDAKPAPVYISNKKFKGINVCLLYVKDNFDKENIYRIL